MSNPENNIANSQSKGKNKARVQLNKVQLDHNFFQKPKIIALEYRFGQVGVLLFIQALCDMGKATNGEIDIDCIRARFKGRSLEESKADEFIAYCLEREMFRPGAKPFLVGNSRIDADQESMAEKQEGWRTKKQLQREKEKTNEGRKEDKQETSTGRMKSELVKNEDLNSSDLFSLKSPEKLSFYGPETIAAVERWGAQRRKKGRTFDIIQAEALLMSYNGRYDDLVKGINHSISYDYFTIVEPANQARAGPKIPVRGGYQSRDEAMEVLEKS